MSLEEDGADNVRRMLTLRLTQKLARRLRVKLPPEVQPATHPCADWCCHVFTVARHRYFLVTHATTYFSVILRAKGATNPSDFVTTVTAGLRMYLADAGHTFAYERFIAPELAAVAFSPVGNRQITGVMNDFARVASFFLTDLSPFETSDRLNEVPVSPLGGKSPVDLFPPG